MIYNKPLPAVRKLLDLAQQVQFPAKAGDVTQSAKNLGYPAAVINFLALFPADQAFDSRTDFVTRSEELEVLIKQEQTTPAEVLRSPQD